MCCLNKEKIMRVTTDVDTLRSEIRDKSVRVIDVRREEDYKKNHIPTSVNLPLATLLSDDAPERVVKLIDYLEKAKEKKDVILLDNRERLNFLEQHIPGAVNIPYRTLGTSEKILRSKEEMKRLLENRGIKPDAEIITYCGSVGTLSGLAYYALKSVNFPNVKLYVRSFKEWKNLNKPIDKQENAHYWDLSAE